MLKAPQEGWEAIEAEFFEKLIKSLTTEHWSRYFSELYLDLKRYLYALMNLTNFQRIN
jgi:hypothetical protein